MAVQKPDKNPNAPRGELIGQGWPAYRYGPNGQAKVFHSATEVPDGWGEHPSDVDPSAKPFDILAQREAAVAKREAEVTAREAAVAKRDKGYVETMNAPTSPIKGKPAPSKAKLAMPAPKPAPQPVVVFDDEDVESDED